jgi:hypothetical protein
VSNVIQLPSRGIEQVLTKKQLGAHLGRSARWVELLARGRPRIVASTEDRLAALERQVGELMALVRGLRRAP